MGSLGEKLQRFDRIFIGILVGGILPILGFIISYFVKTSRVDITFEEYINIAVNNNFAGEQTDILIFSLIPNMLMFYFSNFRWGMYEFTKGLVGITVVMGAGLMFVAT